MTSGPMMPEPMTSEPMTPGRRREAAAAWLAAAGREEEVDLFETALHLAALDQPEADLDACRTMADELRHGVAFAVADTNGRVRDCAVALREAFCERHGFRGDIDDYDNPENANLIRVLERRRGLPVALGILFLDAGRFQGWDIVGLDFPGHFLIRLERHGGRAIIDPFHGGEVLGPAELRALLKVTLGLDAELLPAHYAGTDDRSILLRLQNNLKTRHLANRQLDEASRVMSSMLLIAPQRPDLWREAAIINVQCGRLDQAVGALETMLNLPDTGGMHHEAALWLQRLRERL
jgi:regulator of sirC expression with transglutaminase-like and TPR domain